MNLFLDFTRTLVYGFKTALIMLVALIVAVAFALFLLFATAWLNEQFVGPPMVVENILQNSN